MRGNKPKDAAWDKDLYTVDSDTGEHDGIIEGLFSVAESFAAESLRRLLNAPKDFTEDDRGNLAFLLAIQEQRVPGYLREWEENLTRMGIIWATVELAKTSGPKGKKRTALEAAKAITDGVVSLRPTKENLLSTVLTGVSYTIGPAYILPWTLLRAREGSSFICSDRPLTMHDPAPRHKFTGAAWMSSEMAVTTMPLSSAACLRVVHGTATTLRNATRPHRFIASTSGHTVGRAGTSTVPLEAFSKSFTRALRLTPRRSRYQEKSAWLCLRTPKPPIL